MSYLPAKQWVDFTPAGSWTSNCTYTGRYCTIGNVTFFDIQIQLTGAPDATNLSINPPAGNWSNRFLTVGNGYLYDATNPSNYYGPANVTWHGGSKFFYPVVPTTAPNTMTAISQTVPFTWESGDYIRISTTLEGRPY